MPLDGAALRLLREKDGYTATQFARDLGVSLSYLGDMEAGRRNLARRPDLIRRAADLLHVPISMIQTRTGADQ